MIRYKYWVDVAYDVVKAVTDLLNRKTKRELRDLIDNNRKASQEARDLNRETCHSDHKNCLRNNKNCEEMCRQKFKECINNMDDKYDKDLKENVWPYEKKYDKLN